MSGKADVTSIIGNTALLDLSSLVPNKSVRLLGKYEATNPGGSIKDRVARSMIDAAEADGSLKANGTIIEPTSGNTGVGLAMIAAARGYKVVLVMPETMSIERRKLAAAYGAEIVLTPGAQGMSGSVAKANELMQTIEGAIIAGQFTNPANPRAHYETTGPEIWDATQGEVDVFVAGVGTGGTITGTGRYLKEQGDVTVIAVEPAESQVLSGQEPGAHRIQGIGAGFIPEVYDASVVDKLVAVSSDTAIEMKKRLAREQGLLVGISSGAAVAAAVAEAQTAVYEGKTIVVILPDTGERYLSMDV